MTNHPTICRLLMLCYFLKVIDDQWLDLFVINRFQNDNSVDHLSVSLLFYESDHFLFCYVNSLRSFAVNEVSKV